MNEKVKIELDLFELTRNHTKCRIALTLLSEVAKDLRYTVIECTRYPRPDKSVEMSEEMNEIVLSVAKKCDDIGHQIIELEDAEAEEKKKLKKRQKETSS